MTAGRVFQVAEQMPEYPGGEDAMMKFLRSNLVYPSIPEWDSTTHKSRLVIQFIVNEDGSLSDIEIVKSVYASFDAETLRVVKLFPRFKPGKQNGLAVRVKYLLPIIFDVGMR
jgi:protein TonB